MRHLGLSFKLIFGNIFFGEHLLVLLKVHSSQVNTADDCGSVFWLFLELLESKGVTESGTLIEELEEVERLKEYCFGAHLFFVFS